jgi:hypothetical protein
MAGVGLALAAGFWGMAAGEGFLAGMWPLKEAGVALGSILMFDTGVYLVVVGAVGALFFALESEAEETHDDDDADDDGERE